MEMTNVVPIKQIKGYIYIFFKQGININSKIKIWGQKVFKPYKKNPFMRKWCGF